jgi:precorrin-2 dehydrogenase / sirohydrochlorin ferrochelatase
VPSHYHYPLFVSLEQRVCLVVGGGAVAERKIRSILQFGGSVQIVAEDLTPWLKTQCDKGAVLLVAETYTQDHLQDVDLVFAATNDFALNRTIAEDAAQCRLWCNMATEPERGSFIVPSMLRRGPLTIAVSTGGASPAVAVQIRQKLEREFGAEWIVLLQLMALLRATIQTKGLDTVQNQDIYRRIADLPLLEWIQRGDKAALIEAVLEICQPRLGMMELTQIWNEAWKQSS